MYDVIMWRVRITIVTIETQPSVVCVLLSYVTVNNTKPYKTVQCCHGNATVGSVYVVVKLHNISYC
jgi:hypothetical protein